MGLVKRRNGLFYYRSGRIGRKTNRYYCGGGQVARFAGEMDAYLRDRRAYRREMLQLALGELAAINEAAESLAWQAGLLAKAKLLQAGWHVRKKRKWTFRG